jgi:hypothetical protein
MGIEKIERAGTRLWVEIPFSSGRLGGAESSEVRDSGDPLSSSQRQERPNYRDTEFARPSQD